MLYNRQKQLITLLSALDESLPDPDFHALLFLFCQETEATPSYAFVPHRSGPLSFTALMDRQRLLQKGLLANDTHTWQVTEAGRAAAKHAAPDPERPRAFAEQYAGLRGDALLSETFRRAPYLAIQCESLDRLGLETSVPRRVEAARPASVHKRLSTIGYEDRGIEEYFNLLIQAGVGILCDVRGNPLSRKAGFSKGPLARACAETGIRYEHLPELGIESDKRRGVVTDADYQALFARYRSEWLPKQPEALGQVLAWVHGGEHVALTCYERQAKHCHRYCVAEELRRMDKQLHPAQHL